MTCNDIDEFYEKFCVWKNCLKEKYIWAKNLEKEVLKVKAQEAVVEKRNTDLHSEVLQLNEILLEARKTISNLTDLENANKNLKKDIEQLKCQLEESVKANEENACKSRDEICFLREKYEKNIKTIKDEAEDKRSKEMEVILEKLKEKDMKICEFESEKKKLVTKQEEELIKVKIEYEEKLERIKMQLSAGQSLPQASAKTEEIFRKKYQKLESQYKEESDTLKKEIRHLMLQNSKLTSNQNSLLFDVDFTKDNTVKDHPKTNANLVVPHQAFFTAQSLKKSTIQPQNINVKKKANDVSIETVPVQLDKNENTNQVAIVKGRVPIKRKKLFNHETNMLLE